MHPIQKRILEVCSAGQLGPLSLRELGRLVDEDHPQKIKHHLEQLKDKELITISDKRIKLTKPREVSPDYLTLPIYGSADCGEATCFADDHIEGYLKVPSVGIGNNGNLMVLKAKGQSMNSTNFYGKNIDDGDYIIIDRNYPDPQGGDLVVSIIDEVANIKRLYFDKDNKQIILRSESTEDYPDVYVDPKKVSHVIIGKVIKIIKRMTEQK